MANCSGNCGSCGNCQNCGGCAKELILTQPEIDMLRTLGQFSFLPVARKADDMTPVYLEDTSCTQEEYSLVLQVLEKKNLIYLDYTPLKGAYMGLYPEHPVHGSMALTQRGQQVLDLLDIQGVQDKTE